MMLTATHDGRRLTDEEAHQVLQLLLIGGIETTTLLLSNLLHRIIVEPELADSCGPVPSCTRSPSRRALVSTPDPGPVPHPEPHLHRAGVQIPKDAKTMVLFAAGQPRPALWDHPHEFRLDRDARRCDATTASATATICASAPRWPDWRAGWRCERSWSGCPGVHYEAPPSPDRRRDCFTASTASRSSGQSRRRQLRQGRQLGDGRLRPGHRTGRSNVITSASSAHGATYRKRWARLANRHLPASRT